MSDFVHMELTTTDPTAAKNFYSKVFGWKFKSMPMPGGDYLMFQTGGKGPHGGFTPPMMPGQPSGWLGYVGVKSVKATVAKARAAGAKVHLEYQEIPPD